MRLLLAQGENSICLSVKIISSGFSFLNSCSRIKVDVDPFLLGKDLELNILSKLEESLQNDEGNDNISQLKNHMQMNLIYKGKVIKSEERLASYQLSRASVVMCCISSRATDQVASVGESFSSVRNAAQVLSGSDARPERADAKLQILDQKGKPVKMSANNRQHLTAALALTEQGQQLMAEEKFSDAVFVLLEADADFKECGSSLLDMVDNYALLQLDIVSCYLHLANVDQLPDALARIQLAEEKLKRVYGEGMARVARIKGAPYQEQAMMVKLLLMKGVALFYAKKYPQAKDCLSQALQLLTELQVNPDTLQEMLLMGFSESEARLALRACQNDVTSAINHAFTERDRKEKVQRETRRAKLEERLGRTYSGQPVNIDQYEALVGMKFPKFACTVALKRFNNDIDTCLRVLQDECYDELLCYSRQESGLDCGVDKIDEMNLAKLLSSFTCKSSAEDPEQYPNNTHISKFHMAAALFVNNNKLEEAELFLTCPDKLSNLAHNIERIHHGKDTSQNTEGEAEREERRKKENEAQKALRDVIKNQTGEDYLDLDLHQEKCFIQQYLALLQSVSNQVANK